MNPVQMAQMAEITTLAAQVAEKLDGFRGDPVAAASDAELYQSWERAEPETRAAMLLFASWETRAGTLPITGTVPIDDETAGLYACDLHSYARNHTGTQAEFIGANWPAMPLPGSAGALSSSLGFDRDDTDISLLTLLLLITAGGN